MKKIILGLLLLFGFSSFGCTPKTPEKSNEVMISFYDGDVLIETKNYKDNIVLVNYSKDNYEFSGWYLDKDFSKAFDSSKISEYFEKDTLNLYAKMVKVVKEMDISYYDGSDLIETKHYIDEISLLDFSKDGYEFEGWYLDNEFRQAFDSSKISEYFELKTINLYAKVTKLTKELTVYFFDGTKLIERKVYVDNIELIQYSKENYNFGGWYLDRDFKTLFDTSKIDEYFTLKSLNLYAKMERIMKDYNIKIKGLIEDENYVVNPIFEWENVNEDSSFIVILSLNGEIEELEETRNTNYQFKKLLNSDCEYEIKIKGKTSAHENSLKFRTAKDVDYSVKSITLDNPFSDSMVIQRNKDTYISGIGPTSQLLKISFEDKEFYEITDASGHFSFKLDARPASFDPINITISNGINANKTLANVLFGDVYLFAGQSNMQWPTQHSDYQQSDIEKLSQATVRFFAQDVTTSSTKQDYVKNGRWFIPNESNCGGFSAIASISGALLGYELKDEVPIGIITAYQGDTNIANWMGQEYYFGQTSTKHLHYNAMVYPLRHMSINGVVWYQGCNNSGAGSDYKDLLLGLFANYRDLFNNENMNFFVIGLACYDGDAGNNYDFSYVRESQAMACALDEHAYFISSADDGDKTFIHPSAKHYICERVAKSISSVLYGKDYLAEGPTYKSHEVNGSEVIISFDNALGLKCSGEINGFLIAGSDGKYYPATARIEGETIVASSPYVENPVYIKYGFEKSPFVNIFNKDNYSLVPFRTDNYNTNIDLFNYYSTTDYYYHESGSNMKVSIKDNNLVIQKQNDGIGYGSIRLDKWGAVAYQPQGFQFSFVGTNSGASVAMRFIEGTYEIWSYKVVDDFVGLKTFTIGITDLVVSYNKINGIFEPQKIAYIELMIESYGAVTIELNEARFIEMERTKPFSFNIGGASENDEAMVISVNKALFVESYELKVFKKDDSNPIYASSQASNIFNIDKSLFEIGVGYYVYVNAINELGSTSAKNDGFVFYLKDPNQLILFNFDFEDQGALDGYLSSGILKVHSGLHCILDEQKGIRINSDGQGWQYFIFVLESGSADGMTKLEFYGDFTNYHGNRVVIQLNTSAGLFNHTLDLSTQKEGIFTINFSDFKYGSMTYNGQSISQVMFNFDDYDTSKTSYLYFDDCRLVK